MGTRRMKKRRKKSNLRCLLSNIFLNQSMYSVENLARLVQTSPIQILGSPQQGYTLIALITSDYLQTITQIMAGIFNSKGEMIHHQLL
jgi:hypothetical protein